MILPTQIPKLGHWEFQYPPQWEGIGRIALHANGLKGQGRCAWSECWIPRTSPASFGVGSAWLSAVTTAIVVSAGFGMLDVQLYRYLKNAVDLAGEEHRRRKVNLYAGAFVIASLIGVLIT